MEAAALSRPDFVSRGRRLQYFTIVYNSAEGLVSVAAGLLAGSVSLIGFGVDSLIEVTSGAAVLWRPHHDLDPPRRGQIQSPTLRILGACFLPLAAHILFNPRLA